MRFRAFGSLVAALAIVAGCSGSGSPSPSAGVSSSPAGTAGPASPSPAAPTPSPGAAGGVLVAGIGGEPDQLDPPNTSSYFSFEVLENVYDTLVEPDANLEMGPALATSWDTSADGLTWTFHLRQGVTWQDGTPFSSADVVYTYKRIIDGKLPNSWRFGAVSDVTAPDAATVVIKVKQPTPNLLAKLGSFKGTAIVLQKNVESGEIARHPVGTGPFKLTEWKAGDSIKLEANKDYWGGAPKLDGVTFKFIPESTVAMANLKGGEIQWTDNIPPQQVAALKADTSIVVQSAPSNDYWYFAPNEKRTPYSNPLVRQALAWAIDRPAITEAAQYGNATPNQMAIPKTSAWYVEYAPYSHDVAKAKALLAQAGVTSLSMDLMVTSEYPESVAAAQVIASNLADVGITVKIRTLDFATWLDEESKGNFDVFLLSWLGNLDPDDFYYAQHHTGADFDFQGYSNPKVDALLDQGRTETDVAKRKDLYGQAAKQIVDDASYVYLYNPDVVQAWSPRVSGYLARGDRAIRFRETSLGQ